MSEAEEPIEFEPGLPAEEVARRIRELAKRVQHGEEKVAFYRSLADEAAEQEYTDEHGTAPESSGHSFEVELDDEVLAQFEMVRAQLSSKLGREASNEEVFEHVLRHRLGR